MGKLQADKLEIGIKEMRICFNSSMDSEEKKGDGLRSHAVGRQPKFKLRIKKFVKDEEENFGWAFSAALLQRLRDNGRLINIKRMVFSTRNESDGNLIVFLYTSDRPIKIFRLFFVQQNGKV